MEILSTKHSNLRIIVTAKIMRCVKSLDIGNALQTYIILLQYL